MGLWCTEGTRSAQPDWVCAADLTLPHKGGSTRRAQPPCVRPLHKKGSPAGHTQHSRACFVPHRGTPVLHILSLMGLQGSAFPPERAFWRADISQRGRLRVSEAFLEAECRYSHGRRNLDHHTTSRPTKQHPERVQKIISFGKDLPDHQVQPLTVWFVRFCSFWLCQHSSLGLALTSFVSKQSLL